MNVAGSASGTHKHDGDNTTKYFKIGKIGKIYIYG